MNYIKKYNNELGGLDIDDMISNYYYFWAVGVILANEYIIYICINNMQVTQRKHRLSNHELKRKQHVHG